MEEIDDEKWNIKYYKDTAIWIRQKEGARNNQNHIRLDLKSKTITFYFTDWKIANINPYGEKKHVETES